MAAQSELVKCDDLVELPIEHACKTIHILQSISEFDDITVMLKERLVELFKDVPYLKGKKSYKHYEYLPSGVCDYRWGGCQIVLKPYLTPEELKLAQGGVGQIVETKEKKFAQSYSLLGNINSLWLLQLKAHLKRNLTSSMPKIAFFDAIEKYQMFKDLSVEEQKVLNKDLNKKLSNQLSYFSWWFTRDKNEQSLQTDCNSNCNSNCYENRHEIHHDQRKIRLLSEEGLKKIIEFYSNFDCNDNLLGWKTVREIDNFLSEDLDAYVINTNISYVDFQTQDGSPRNRYYNWDFEQFVTVGYPKILQFLEQQPQFRPFFEKMKIVPKIKKQ